MAIPQSGDSAVWRFRRVAIPQSGDSAEWRFRRVAIPQSGNSAEWRHSWLYEYVRLFGAKDI